MADTTTIDDDKSFLSLSNLIDTRILKALSDLGFARPTLIQSKAIPLTLEGRDVLARARTGSGKTAAYCIPTVQKVLSSKTSASSSDAARRVRALILVPTRELAEQVTSHLKAISRYCEKDVVVTNVASNNAGQVQQALLSEEPDVIVGTPTRILSLLQSQSLSLGHIETLVVDEADLILSYGHDEDIRKIISGPFLPKNHQTVLMSATMTEDVVALKGLALRRPVILKLEEDEDETANLTQFYATCTEQDKFLLLYVILKLRLVKGKCLIFVNDVDRSYRLKLFLEQFSIKSCVLNSELPLNSRYHVVQEFNRGAYEYIIATDESTETPISAQETSEPSASSSAASVPDDPEAEAIGGIEEDDHHPEDPASEGQAGEKRKRQDPSSRPLKSKKRKSGKRRDDEYGVSRGIDFVNVACVVNFDFPTTSNSYTHRVGRTARAGKSGMALSFILATDNLPNDNTTVEARAHHEETVFKDVAEEQAARGSKMKEYKFDMKQVEAFRYRMNDAFRAVTKNAIKEARLKELKSELLKSEKLKAHFEDNPLDLEYLRHDQPLNPMRVQPHMKHVPNYLLPGAAPSASEWNEGLARVPYHKKRHGRGRGRGRGGNSRGGMGGRSGKKRDPLKKF